MFHGQAPGSKAREKKKSGPRKDGKIDERSDALAATGPTVKKERPMLRLRENIYMCPLRPVSRPRSLVGGVVHFNWTKIGRPHNATICNPGLIDAHVRTNKRTTEFGTGILVIGPTLVLPGVFAARPPPRTTNFSLTTSRHKYSNPPTLQMLGDTDGPNATLCGC